MAVRGVPLGHILAMLVLKQIQLNRGFELTPLCGLR